VTTFSQIQNASASGSIQLLEQRGERRNRKDWLRAHAENAFCVGLFMFLTRDGKVNTKSNWYLLVRIGME